MGSFPMASPAFHEQIQAAAPTWHRDTGIRVAWHPVVDLPDRDEVVWIASSRRSTWIERAQLSTGGTLGTVTEMRTAVRVIRHADGVLIAADRGLWFSRIDGTTPTRIAAVPGDARILERVDDDLVLAHMADLAFVTVSTGAVTRRRTPSPFPSVLAADGQVFIVDASGAVLTPAPAAKLTRVGSIGPVSDVIATGAGIWGVYRDPQDQCTHVALLRVSNGTLQEEWRRVLPHDAPLVPTKYGPILIDLGSTTSRGIDLFLTDQLGAAWLGPEPAGDIPFALTGFEHLVLRTPDHRVLTYGVLLGGSKKTGYVARLNESTDAINQRLRATRPEPPQ